MRGQGANENVHDMTGNTPQQILGRKRRRNQEIPRWRKKHENVAISKDLFAAIRARHQLDIVRARQTVGIRSVNKGQTVMD